MKILVIRFSSIGDIVWTTPTLRALKTQLPHATLHFCTKLQYRAMMAQNPYIDKLHTLDKDLNALIAELKAEQFDVVIDLHRNLRSRLIKWRLGKKSYTYQKYSWARWFLVKFKINHVPHTHVADWYMETVKPLGVVPDGKGLDFFLSPTDDVPLSALPAPHQTGFVGLVIGASEWNKKLPPHKLIELCEKLACPVALIGGKEDAEAGEALARHFEGHTTVHVFNACGKFNIPQSASILKKARFTIGHDTGLMHIAAAFDKPVYGIYGGTISQYLRPYSPLGKVIEHPQLACRPCSKAGKSHCPQRHFKCMEELQFPDFKEL